MKKNKIGIMGGTFDPIHLGHLIVAEEIRIKFDLNKVIFIPTGSPPHKNGTYSNANDRYIMTLLATNDNPYFEVNDIEINRKGKSYSYDTLLELHKIYSNTEFYFITGLDAIIELETWKNVNEVVKLCRFIAVTRPGYDFKKAKNDIHYLNKKYNANIYIAEVTNISISSTEIRNKIYNNEPIKYLLTGNVINYIRKNELYKNRCYYE